MTEQPIKVQNDLTALERFLRLFANVNSHEGLTSLLLCVNIFLILMAYYFIKPVREGWLAVSVVQGLTKLELKAYSAFGQSMLLIAVLPVYAMLTSKWPRRKLIRRTGSFFAVLMVIFWLLQPEFVFELVPYAGLAFYLFVGIFSVTLVAQFWAFASDLYGPERGKRLFPLVAIGASAGAACGAWVGESLLSIERVDSFDLIIIALLPLWAALELAAWSDRRGTEGQPSELTQARWDEPAAPQRGGAYKTILEHRYLGATALMVALFSWVVASGDNILFALVQEHLAKEFELQGLSGPELSRLMKNATTAFYSDLYLWVNVSGLLIQAFLVSRLLKLGGFGLLMLATPLVSLAAYVSMAVAPVIGIIKAMKVAENSSSYSVHNTARHLLWLPTTKEMMYQAKAVIDTLFVRIGDGLAALTVLIGTRVVSFSLTSFIAINIVLVVGWVLISWFLVQENRRWQARIEAVPA